MLKKIAALFAAALIATLTLAPQAHAQSYGPKLPTTTTITVVKAVDGQPLVVRFSVSAADGTSPAGHLTYTISRAAGAARSARLAMRATAGSVQMAGSPRTVTGPVAHVGSYVIGASFTPTNSARYLPSSSVNRATVGAAAPGGGGGGSTSISAGGGLPNTGGPDLAWLLAGVALVGAGAGTVAFARRRTPAAA